jgi:magnesium transporter
MTTTKARLYCAGKVQDGDLDLDRVDTALKEPDALVWVDVDDPTAESLAALQREFGFHDLAIEDCLHPHQRPKIEQFEDHFFAIAYGVGQKDGELIEHEIGIFVGHNYLVTVRKPPVLNLEPVVTRWEAHSDLTKQGGGWLLYILLDQIVDGYFDVLDAFEDMVEDIEDQVFGQQVGERVQARIFGMKKQMLAFRRRIAPLREVLDVLQRRSVDVVTQDLEPYYRDVYDHVLRATDFVDNLRDILTSALEASLAVISNRLNEVMKRLTSWASIILVPTLIAGIYGMNFRHMPELLWRWGYAYALVVMAGSAFALYAMFKRRGWL